MSIESMSSREFSVGIFFFLIIAILIFVGITMMYMFKDKGKQLKTGEKWMFAWILFGVVVAVAFGAVQLMDGYLF
jgi:TRAP-type C4-dicarboxylate transport system permease small subunit